MLCRKIMRYFTIVISFRYLVTKNDVMLLGLVLFTVAFFSGDD